jgi:hypothetical protein
LFPERKLLAVSRYSRAAPFFGSRHANKIVEGVLVRSRRACRGSSTWRASAHRAGVPSNRRPHRR